MPVSVLLKSSATVRVSCSAQSSFCFKATPDSTVGGLGAGADGRGAGEEGALGAAAAALGTGGAAGSNWMRKYFCWSQLANEIAQRNSAVAPPLRRNFSPAAGVGVCSQRARNCSALCALSGAQIALNRAVSPDTVAPNALTAAALAWRMAPVFSTSNAGQPALSSAPKNSEVIVFTLDAIRYRLRRARGLRLASSSRNPLGSNSRTANRRTVAGFRLSATNPIGSGADSES